MARAIVKESGKDVDMPDQEEIVDGSGVGDDELHPSKSQAFEILNIPANVIDGDVGPDLVSPQKVVEFETGLKARSLRSGAFDRRSDLYSSMAKPSRTRRERSPPAVRRVAAISSGISTVRFMAPKQSLAGEVVCR
jgi:hypothetical protein